MGVLAALIGIPALAYPAWVLARRARLERWTLTLLAATLIAWSELVVLAWVLSAFGAFTRAGLLGAEAAVAAVVVVALRRELVLPRPAPGRALAGLRALGTEHTVLAGLVAVALVLNLVLALTVAPNNPDALSYHLSRAAYWIQDGSVLHFHGASVQQAAMPPNGELVIGWLMALTGSDALVQVVQYLAYCVVLAGVYEGARLLRFGPRAALLAALLFGAMPQPLLQASSAQNDLVAAAPLLAALVFGVRGVRKPAWPELALAAAALGLAAGTKTTSLVAVPVVAVLVAAAAWRTVPRRRLAAFGAAAVVAVAVLGAPNYVANLSDYGSPLGPADRPSTVGGDPRTPTGRSAADRFADVTRTAWNSFVQTVPVDADWVGDALEPAARAADEKGSSPVRAGVDEDLSGYGLLGLLVLVPCWLYALVRGPWDRRALALGAALAVVLLVSVFPYTAAAGRVILPYVALAAPLLALADRRGWTRAGAVAVACAAALPVVLVNPSKPLLPYDGTSVVQLDRLEQMTRRSADARRSLTALRQVLPDDAPLGLYARERALDFPLFGEGLERRVERVVRGRDDERKGIVNGRRVRAIYYAGTRPPPGAQAMPLPGGDKLVWTSGPVTMAAGRR